MPNWLRALPLWLRAILGVSLILLAAMPGLAGPGIAESYGLSRSTGSTIGGLISLVLFILCYLLGIRMSRYEARREVVQEMDKLLEPYRDDEGHQGENPK